MKQTINFDAFKDKFQRIRPTAFSNEGLKALFDYLERLEETIPTEEELDVIALCCEFTEYSLRDFKVEYGNDYETIEEAEHDYVVIPIEGTDRFIIQG